MQLTTFELYFGLSRENVTWYIRRRKEIHVYLKNMVSIMYEEIEWNSLSVIGHVCGEGKTTTTKIPCSTMFVPQF